MLLIERVVLLIRLGSESTEEACEYEEAELVQNDGHTTEDQDFIYVFTPPSQVREVVSVPRLFTALLFSLYFPLVFSPLLYFPLSSPLLLYPLLFSSPPSSLPLLSLFLVYLQYLNYLSLATEVDGSYSNLTLMADVAGSKKLTTDTNLECLSYCLRTAG